MPPSVLGIVFDQIPLLDDFSHFTVCDHSIGPGHLSHGVWQVPEPMPTARGEEEIVEVVPDDQRCHGHVAIELSQSTAP